MNTTADVLPLPASAATDICRGVFLDFDGVFHPTTVVADLDMTHALDDLTAKHDLFRWTSDLAKLLVGHEDVMLFVHSSWKSTLSNMGMRQALGPLGHLFEGVTDKEQSRLMSIESKANQAGLSDYLVLDDARDLFPEDYAPLVLCNPLTGISDPVVQRKVATWLAATQPNVSANAVLA